MVLEKIWSLRMPEKMAHFMWRVCNGCLPTMYALPAKQITSNALCPWCRSNVETDAHILFTCDFAQTVWYSAGIQQMKPVLGTETAFDVFRRLFDTCTNEECVQIGLISWCL